MLVGLLGIANGRATTLEPEGIDTMRSLAGSYDQQHEPAWRMPAPRDTCCALGLQTVKDKVTSVPGAVTVGFTATFTRTGLDGVGVASSGPNIEVSVGV